MCRVRDPHFHPVNFRSGADQFHKLQKKIRSGAWHHSTFFWRILPFRRPSFSKISLISARAQSVRQRRGLAAGHRAPARSTRPDTSGDSHFHAQNGSSPFRSPTFSSSKRLKLVPEPRNFTLDRELVPEPRAHFSLCRGTYQNLGWVPPPRPPGPPLQKNCMVHVWYGSMVYGISMVRSMVDACSMVYHTYSSMVDACSMVYHTALW